MIILKKVRKAVIPVAGMGTRFLPVTKSVPKEMLPTLAEQALHDVCTGGNPREVTKEDILAIYQEAYE